MIGIYYIATGPYKVNIDGFLSTLKYFFPNEKKVVSLMIDEEYCGDTYEVDLRQHIIQHYPWPVVTLYKFHLMHEYKIDGAEMHFYFNSNIKFNQVEDFDWNILKSDELILNQHTWHSLINPYYTQACALCIPDNLFDEVCSKVNDRVNYYTQCVFKVPEWHDETVYNEVVLKCKKFPYHWFPVKECGYRLVKDYKNNSDEYEGITELVENKFKYNFKRQYKVR